MNYAQRELDKIAEIKTWPTIRSHMEAELIRYFLQWNYLLSPEIAEKMAGDVMKIVREGKEHGND